MLSALFFSLLYFLIARRLDGVEIDRHIILTKFCCFYSSLVRFFVALNLSMMELYWDYLAGYSHFQTPILFVWLSNRFPGAVLTIGIDDWESVMSHIF